VRFHDFRTISRSRTLPEAVDSGTVIARVASDLLTTVDPTAGVRLLGVGVGNLTEQTAHQLTLDDIAAESWPDADRAVDEIRRRFGERAVGPAALVSGDGLRLKRRGDQQWGPGEEQS
jgi:DNA polymerase-4